MTQTKIFVRSPDEQRSLEARIERVRVRIRQLPPSPERSILLGMLDLLADEL